MGVDAKAFHQQLVAASSHLLEILDRFSSVRVLVIGDLGLDEFLTGEVERVSREAPVLILRHEETRQVPGGGANAVSNVAALGGQVLVAGVVGADEQGRAIRHILESMGADCRGVLVDGDRPTVTKTRISGHARQSVTQQIVRVDRKSDAMPDVALQEQLAHSIHHILDAVDCVICSDYGDGVFTSAVIQAALAHPQVIVDAQWNLHRFAGAMVFTPNIPEAERAVGYAIADPASLRQAGTDLLQQTQARYVLLTRGEDGMTFFQKDETPQSIPAFNRTDVFDVTGAGDTVTAALTLALASGASFWEAAVLGNLAASLVVRQFGTSTTTVDDLREALSALVHTTWQSSQIHNEK